MTEPNEINDDTEIIDAAPEVEPIEYESAPVDVPAADASASWFGYIGAGIVIFSMIIGLVGVVVAVLLFIRWTQ